MIANDFLRGLFDCAVRVADPMQSLARALPPKPDGRVVVIGAGKASARMAEAVEADWGPCEGLVITRYGYARACQGIEIVEASHPVPDEAGEVATKRMVALLNTVAEGDFVLALISGGGSALLCAPVADVSLEEKQALTANLLASGAPIGTINGIRKEISAVKGGRLAAVAFPAQLLALMISDVPGDDPGDIASGPTVGHDGSAARALKELDKWGVEPAPSIRAYLQKGGDPVLPNDPRLAKTKNVIYAAPSQSLEAAAEQARAAGFVVEMLGDSIEGEARDVAAEHAVIAMNAPPGTVILSGGELTVTRLGDGVGGPNAEYALALAIALNGKDNIHAIACDTDGVDGAAEVAGAVIGPGTLTKATTLSPQDALANNDAHSFFASINDQVVTGPTLTNVNDFRAILVL